MVWGRSDSKVLLERKSFLLARIRGPSEKKGLAEDEDASADDRSSHDPIPLTLSILKTPAGVKVLTWSTCGGIFGSDLLGAPKP